MKKITAFLFLTIIVSCGNNRQIKSDEPNKNLVSIPQFNADSAYTYIARQVEFGPRVPQTTSHEKCATYLLKELTIKCDTAILQEGWVELYDNRLVKCKNIIGSFLPEKKSRILLCAHWDTRPFSDQEEDKDRQYLPILGADDGASGCGVLIEIARQLQLKKPNIGIDIILFDMEDYGVPNFYNGIHKEHTWCLGSQYWSMNPHKRNYQARYGILLDMVGGANATFYQEKLSTHFASQIVNKVWSEAKKLGFSSYFLNNEGGTIVDDHLYINQLAKIPCIDIIRHNPTSKTGFSNYWHTQNDDMSNISKETLFAVGQTLLHVIYNEK